MEPFPAGLAIVQFVSIIVLVVSLVGLAVCAGIVVYGVCACCDEPDQRLDDDDDAAEELDFANLRDE